MTRGATWLGVGAMAWAAALVFGAYVVPVYESESSDSLGGITHSSETLVAVNGAGVVAVVAVPLVAALLGVVALRTGHRRIAWAIVGVLAVFCVVSIFTIGVFVAPVAVLLALAARRG